MLNHRTLLALGFLASFVTLPSAPAAPTTNAVPSRVSQFMEANCLDCHNGETSDGGLDLETLLRDSELKEVDHWEAVVKKLFVRQMPPAGYERPTETDYQTVLDALVQQLDARAPQPGRTDSLRRMNRTEYQNAIRDLLALDVDIAELLPKDQSSHGFDNVTVTGLSPVLLDRYVSAAQKISRLAIGIRAEEGAERTFRIKPDVTQDTHLSGTPLGTRGGMVVEYVCPQSGEYEVEIRLARDRNEEVEGLRGEHVLEVQVDGALVDSFDIKRPEGGGSDKFLDADLTARIHLDAGVHSVGVLFQKQPSSLLETLRQPLNVHYNYYRHPRIGPAVYQVTVRGPFDGKVGNSMQSRQRIFVCYPANESEYEDCARQILADLMRRAYRRPIDDEDLKLPLQFFRTACDQDGFDAGIEQALGAILVNPNFLFRIERQPEELPANTPYALTPLELASRLSFFMWSSVPDEELLAHADDGSLLQPDVWEAQVRRMLADPRASSLVENFADQWLYLRILDSFIPDMRLYPDFDDNLRQALRRETELFFANIVSQDRSILELLRADYTYLNERLAKHYGVPHVYGSHFRRVKMNDDWHRGGLLRQGSILTVTSYATRTSPVIRGNWVLENIVGNPPPPPPPDVPTLDENTVAASLPLRERLEQHRANEACSGCHNQIDPIGFALENYNAIGQWRDTVGGEPIDTVGELWDGSSLAGVADLEQALLNRPEWFAKALSEKLMTFALGRGVDTGDAAAIRKVVAVAAADDYRFSAIVVGLTKGVPFQMRTTE